MDLRTPNSHTFSFIFCVVEIRIRKKARMRAMEPTIITNIWKRKRELLTLWRDRCLSRRIVASSLK